MKWIETVDGQTLLHVENEADVDALLGFIGEGETPHDDKSYDLRIKLHELKDRYKALREQPSLFDSSEQSVPAVPILPATPTLHSTALLWSLEHTREEVTNEWESGYQAGWRGDELVTEKSPAYLFAYEQGQVGRQAYDERF